MMDTFTRFEGKAADWLARDYQRRIEQATVRRAYRAFARRYRRWANSLFDLTFLQSVPSQILMNGDAWRLAEAYAAQLTYTRSPLHARYTQMAVPVAAAFLQLLEKERGREERPVMWNVQLV